MNEVLLRLEEHLNEIKATNDKLGFTYRVDSIRKLIAEFGWGTISTLYHPDNNTKDKARYEMYQLVKFVYEYDLKTN